MIAIAKPKPSAEQETEGPVDLFKLFPDCEQCAIFRDIRDTLDQDEIRLSAVDYGLCREYARHLVYYHGLTAEEVAEKAKLLME